MAEKGFFFDAIAGAPTYASSEFVEFLETLFVAGVRKPETGALQVAAQSPAAMAVNVAAGWCQSSVNGGGYGLKLDVLKSLVIAANASGSTRVDSIVGKIDILNRTAVVQVVQGTPGAGAPSLTNDANTRMVELARVTVANGAISITTPNIEDRRIAIALNTISDNLLINGGFDIFQRQAPGTATARSDDTYGPDRWYVLTQSAAINCERSNGDFSSSGATNNSVYAVKLTQNQAAAQRLGLAQIIEGLNAIPFRNRSIRFQARVKCSASQPIRAAIVQHTGTQDSVTSDIVNDWVSTDYTDGASRFFVDANLIPLATAVITPATGTWADLSVTGIVNSNTTNLIVFIWTEGTAAQNVTLEITQAGLYDTSAPRPWLPRSTQAELALCQRYCYVVPTGGPIGSGLFMSTTAAQALCFFPVIMRITPTLSYVAIGNFMLRSAGGDLTATNMNLVGGTRSGRLDTTVASGGTAGQATLLLYLATDRLTFDAEL